MQMNKHPWGFWEVSPKPSATELQEYYNDKYIARKVEVRGYTEEEIKHKEIDCREAYYLMERRDGTLLDLGCGEGFFLDFFQREGWDVEGVDYSDEGILKRFPNLSAKVQVGDVMDNIGQLIRTRKKYDLITCNNVLEHVLDPANILKQVRQLLKSDGLLRISVPNDFSPIQGEIVDRQFADENYWVTVPDHLNYFNADSLATTMKESGFRLMHYLADFPISFYIFNPDSNYMRDSTLGKNCHYARVAVENTLYGHGIEKLIEFRKGCARSGIGRVLIAYCSLS
jgi:2-polyprenyl-3-methyl-5-hydroxy-6-metoxy-1,4-benzoquinol methylase